MHEQPTVYEPNPWQSRQFFLSTKTAGPAVLWCTACSRSTRAFRTDVPDDVERLKQSHKCGPTSGGNWS